MNVLRPGRVAWIDGALRAEPQLVVAAHTHAFHQASCVFEGIRWYDTDRGPGIAFLDEHVGRLLESARLMCLDSNLDAEDVRFAILQCVASSRSDYGYIRPMIYASGFDLGLATATMQVKLAVLTWDLGPSTPEVPRPVELAVSPWRRPRPDTYPIQAKTAATYGAASVAKNQALAGGFDDALQLNGEGRVAEATTANIFARRGDRLLTPPLSEGILAGITRSVVLSIADEIGLRAEETPLTVADIVVSDEVFLCGTAAEITPVGRIASYRIPAPGPVTQKLRSRYLDGLRDSRSNRCRVTTL